MSEDLNAFLGFGDDESRDQSDWSCVKPGKSLSRSGTSAFSGPRGGTASLQFTPGKSRLSRESVEALRVKFSSKGETKALSVGDAGADGVVKPLSGELLTRQPLAARAVNVKGNPLAAPTTNANATVSSMNMNTKMGSPASPSPAPPMARKTEASPVPRKIRFADEDELCLVQNLHNLLSPPSGGHTVHTANAGSTPAPRKSFNSMADKDRDDIGKRETASDLVSCMPDSSPAEALYSPPPTVPSVVRLSTGGATTAPDTPGINATDGPNAGVSRALPAVGRGGDEELLDGIARRKPRARGGHVPKAAVVGVSGASESTSAHPQTRVAHASEGERPTQQTHEPEAETEAEAEADVGDRSVSIEEEDTLPSLADLIDLDAMAMHKKHQVLHPHEVAMRRARRDLSEATKALATEDTYDVDDMGDNEDGSVDADQSVMTTDSCASDMLTAATTLSIDHDFAPDLDFLNDGDNILADPQPAARMLVGPRYRRRDLGGQGGVKEIILSSPVGSESAVHLAFGNERPFTQTMRMRAYQMRFEPSPSSSAGYDTTDLTVASTDQAFKLSKGVFVIPPGETEMLTVSFSPNEAGVYSGVLKLKCGGKSFVLLLRGETVSLEELPSTGCASPVFPADSPLSSVVDEPAAVVLPNKIGGARRIPTPARDIAGGDDEDVSYSYSYSRDESGWGLHEATANVDDTCMALGGNMSMSDTFSESSGHEDAGDAEDAQEAVETTVDVSAVDVSTEFGLADLLWSQPATGVMDAFALKEKWVVSWLRKARGRGYVLSPSGLSDDRDKSDSFGIEEEERIVYRTNQNKRMAAPPSGKFASGRQMYLSVTPHVLQTKYSRDETGLPSDLSGSLFIHNSSGVELEIGVATSSASIQVRQDTFKVKGNTGVCIDVRVLHEPFSDPRTPLPPPRSNGAIDDLMDTPSSISSSSSAVGPDDWKHTHVGYLMVSDSLGEEFVCEIRRPSTASLLSTVAPSPAPSVAKATAPARALDMEAYGPAVTTAERLVPQTMGVCPLIFDATRASFGNVRVNSLNKREILVTNRSSSAVTLHLSDPQLPFVLLKDKISVPAGKTVPVQVRFVPISANTFTCLVTGQVITSHETFSVSLNFSGQAK